MKIQTKLNHKNINAICKDMNNVLFETADAIKSDLLRSQTMPFYSGELQNRSTYVDKSKSSKGRVSIVSDTPYARRIYYHPEYNFRTDKNPNAGAMWFQPYIDGNKKALCRNVFKRILGSKYK